MKFDDIANELGICGIEYVTLENTADLVSFKIGGKARLVVYPKNINEMIATLCILKKATTIILGKGTNCYFDNSLLNIVVIVTKYLNRVSVCTDTVNCQCGASINKICMLSCENSLSGMEFAYGIPGSIGGAVYMNASAFGFSMSDIVNQTVAFDIENNKIITFDNSSHRFGIKDSIFRNNRFVILECSLELSFGKQEIIKARMQEYWYRRKNSQPLDMPSAGSTFVNPNGEHASKLIDLCGLKGYTVGGAQVSTKHAGFIVNTGSATASDVNRLIKIIKEKVNEKFNVELNQEILYIK